MADITEEKRAWVKAMLGIDLAAPGDENESDDQESETGMRAKRGSKGAKSRGGDTVRPLPEDFAGMFGSAKSGWSTAIGDVDSQISELQKAMAKSPDEEIRDIAQHALSGVTTGYKQLLDAYMKAVGDGSNAAAVRKEGPGLLGAVSDFRATIEKDRQIAVMDDNPFNCPVSIKATLGPVLDQIESALRHGLA